MGKTVKWVVGLVIPMKDLMAGMVDVYLVAMKVVHLVFLNFVCKLGI